MVDSGQSLSHYTILRPLGKGGMGEVFLAEDTVLGRKVALKFLSKDAIKDSVARGRFLREAKSAAAIDDPFICKIYETGEVDGEPFIAMEYIEGESLGDRIAREPMSLEEVVTTAEEIAEALGVAHEHGIIHRDLKPSNIMLTTQGHAKVLDFGLAKQVFTAGKMDTSAQTATSDDLTGRGVTLGTLSYMSPEQLRALPLTPRSDVFSFGIVLHEMLTGNHPFTRYSSPETINAIMSDEAPAPENKEGKIPQKLLDIHDKTLAKDPEDRYQNASEVFQELSALKQTLAPPKKKGIHTIGIGIAMVLAAIIVVAGLRLLPRGTEPSEIPDALSVLIADFDNQTGDEVFNGVLEQATRIGLEGASFINAYRRGDARKVAEVIQPGDSTLDEEMARLVAQREGINVVVAGSIGEENGNYAISVRAIDGATGEVIESHRIESEHREGVLVAVGNLAGRTRESLGDTTPESVRMAAKETFTAASLEAAHAYAQTQELVAGGKFEEAFQAYSEAVELDPDFGRAFAGMAVSTVNMGQAEKAVEYFELAMQHIDRMTEREKYRTRSTYYFTLRNYSRAAEVLQELIDAFPYDQAGLINLPHFYYQARQMGRALEAAQYAVEIYPGSTIANANAALLSVYAGDFENAAVQCESLLESFGNFEPLHICMGLSKLALGNRDAAIARYEDLATVSTWGSSLAAAGLADIALYEGRLDDAAAILNEAVEVALAGDDPAGAARDLATLGHIELLRERPQLAADFARRAILTGQRGRIFFEAARVLISAGEEAEAGEIIQQLANRLAPEPQTYAMLLEGELLLAQGESRRAVDRFLEARDKLDT